MVLFLNKIYFHPRLIDLYVDFELLVPRSYGPMCGLVAFYDDHGYQGLGPSYTHSPMILSVLKNILSGHHRPSVVKGVPGPPPGAPNCDMIKNGSLT